MAAIGDIQAPGGLNHDPHRSVHYGLPAALTGSHTVREPVEGVLVGGGDGRDSPAYLAPGKEWEAHHWDRQVRLRGRR